jgi:Cu/Ag efflux protein CusF
MLRLRLVTLLLIAASSMSSAACHSSDPPEHRYHTRGLVTDLAGSGTERSITIHHEAIPGFVGRDGTTAEMPSMKMAFGAANDVPSELLQPGTQLSFDFDMRWSQRPALWIVHVAALPSGTELTLPEGHEH